MISSHCGRSQERRERERERESVSLVSEGDIGLISGPPHASEVRHRKRECL